MTRRKKPKLAGKKYNRTHGLRFSIHVLTQFIFVSAFFQPFFFRLYFISFIYYFLLRKKTKKNEIVGNSFAGAKCNLGRWSWTHHLINFQFYRARFFTHERLYGCTRLFQVSRNFHHKYRGNTLTKQSVKNLKNQSYEIQADSFSLRWFENCF